MDRYIAALHQIVTRGRNTNSYKFALWRALASLAPTTDERDPVISKDELSPEFLRYYWPLEVKYHSRHFAEWHSRDLSSHIKGLYDQAVADNFPKWEKLLTT